MSASAPQRTAARPVPRPRGLRIIEIPIRARAYGDTKTRVLRHGLLLLRTWWMGVRLFKLDV